MKFGDIVSPPQQMCVLISSTANVCFDIFSNVFTRIGVIDVIDVFGVISVIGVIDVMVSRVPVPRHFWVQCQSKAPTKSDRKHFVKCGTL